jgi:hypothetical protein
MVTTSRRDLILSAAGAGAAFGVDRSLAIAAPARAQKTPDPARGFLRYTIGDAECTAVYAACAPALCTAHPAWHVFDQDAVLAEVSRRKLLERVIADKMLICGSHFPWPGLGKIARDGAGYAPTLHTA